MALATIFHVILRTLRICIFFVASNLGVFPSVRRYPLQSLDLERCYRWGSRSASGLRWNAVSVSTAARGCRRCALN